jgi:DNA-binding CsgD family transcriptional regulator
VLATHLVARESELAQLHGILDAARRGGGALHFIVGEAGIGKSRLARAAVSHADAESMTVLWGRAVPSTSPVPYRPLAEALCAFVRRSGLPDDPELAPFHAALGRLVPEWRVAENAPVEDSVVILGEAVLRFVRVIARTHGCLLVLEDLHWADPETLTVLEYFADNIRTESACCVATLRDDESTPALQLMHSLTARRAAGHIQLARLGEGAVAEMVASCLDVAILPDEVLALAGRADGVPFLVEELLASTAASGALVREHGQWVLSPSVTPVVPITFADSVHRRVDMLGPDARAVLVAAATLGRRFDWRLLSSMTDMSEDRVLSALHAAVDAHLVSVDAPDGALLFRHALTRDAVLGLLLPPERTEVARRARAVIETEHPGLPGEWCELAADLARAADEPHAAAVLLLEVGRRALGAGALASAESALDRARTLVRSDTNLTIDIEECLAEVLSLAGKRDRVFEVGTALLDKLPAGARGAAARTETHLRMARAAVAATDWAQALISLDLARAAAEAAPDPRLVARIDALAAHAAMGAQDPELAIALARDALAQAERGDLPEVACEALEIIGRCDRARDLDAARANFERAYMIAGEHDLTVWRVRALHELGTIDLLSEGRAERLEHARRLAASVGALATVCVLDVQIAASLTMRGDEASVIAVARRAADVARRYRLTQLLAAALAFEAHAYARSGQRAEMEAVVAESEHYAGADPSILMVDAFARAQLAFVEEDRVGALRWLAPITENSWQSVGDQATGPVPGIWALTNVLGCTDEAAGREILELAGRPVHVLARAFLDHAAAVVAGRAGKVDDAVRLSGAADLALVEFPWFRHLARRLVAEAAIVDGWGEHVPPLREAMAYFEARGSDQIASACRSLLRKAGASIPRRRPADEEVPPSLRGLNVTARELEVLRLLGEGRSNRDIAERLFMSHRTVERHVANLTVKTGVARRAELVVFAARIAASDGR